MKKFLSTILIVAGLILPQMLRGQAVDTLSSIVGKTYFRMDVGLTGQTLGIETLDIPVPGVDVVLVAAGDTLKTKTDGQGKFTFSGIATRRVSLSMVNDTYAPFSESFVLMPGENIVIVPRQQKVETLDAASVTAEAPLMTMKGDTLVYHASALTVNEGDYAIDLLMQMPGVEVDRSTGQIKISGKEVARSYVNGALVFGLNPLDPMENLRAEQVVAMEVYDEKNPEEVIDRIVREKQRVVNIKTKDPIFSTTDLQFRAIAGADETKQENGDPQYRYAAGTNAHFFSELVQLSADVVTDNVGMRSSNITAIPEQQSSYRGMTDLELAFNHYWENPLFGNGLNTRYSYTHQKVKNRNRTQQEFFETAGIPWHTQDEESSSSTLSDQHRFETGFVYRTGKLAVVTWRQTLLLSSNRADGRNAGSTIYSGMEPMLKEETSFSGSKNWNLSETVNIRFKPGANNKPRPNVSLGVILTQNDLNSWNLDTLATSYAQRHLTKDGAEFRQAWQGSLEQVLYEYRQERRTFQLTGGYTLYYLRQNRTQDAYDRYGVDEPTINKANTYDYTYSNLNQQFALRSRYNTGNQKISMVSFDLYFNTNRVSDDERYPDIYSGSKTYYFIVPTFSFTTGRVSWSLGSSSKVPSAEQLRPQINDTRPLALTAGNPDLKKTQTYMFRISKGSSMKAKKWTTTWNANLNYETTPWVSKTMFYRDETVLEDYGGYKVPAGGTLNRTENADYALTGNATLRTSSRLSLLKGKLKPTVTLQPSVDYRLMPQYFGEVLDRTTEWTPALNATISAPLWKSAKMSLNWNIAYVSATSSEGTMDRKAIRGQLEVEMSTDFLKYAYFSGNYTWRLFRELSVQDTSRDLQQLNLAVGVNMLKKDLKISLRGIDLLRTGSIYNVTMGPSSVTRSWTPVYGRYFVLDISYRFNNSGGKSMPRYGL